MATIMFDKVTAPPIPYNNENNDPIHNPKGVDASIIKDALCNEYMVLFAKSYNSEKANWKEISDLIKFDEPELIQSLVVHSYDIDIYEKYGRKFTQTKLVDFLELDLKNMKNYIQAIESFIR